MIRERRWIPIAMALAFAGCSGRTGLSGAKPDGSAPVSGNPDTAGPGTVDAVAVSPDLPKGTAILVVNPPSVDFGAVDVGVISAPVTVTVTNAGTTMSGPLAVTVTGTGIAASGCSGMTLAPQASCTIAITAQGTDGPISGTVEVGDSPYTTKRISVTAISMLGPIRLSLSPTSLDLGLVLPGKVAKGTIIVTNESRMAATGIVIDVSGAGFTRSSTGTCTDTLAALQACNLDVSFTAGAITGPAKGAVLVSAGGVTKSVVLTATVVSSGSSVQMVPASASFQTVFGTPSEPFTFNLSGDVSNPTLSVTITGSNKDDFSFTTSCPAAPSDRIASCQVTVVYNPKNPPTVSSAATLTVAVPGPGRSSATAALAGNATPPTTPVDRIPVDNTVPGWTVDPEMTGSKRPMVASTVDDGGKLIDGGIEPYYAGGFSPKMFIWQNYNNTHLPAAPADADNPSGATIMLYVFPMSSAAQARDLYDDLLRYPEYTRKATATSNGWEEPTTPLVGARSRIEDTGSDWFINFQKNEFYVEIRMSPSNGPAPDFAPGNPDLKKEALRFAQAVAQRL